MILRFCLYSALKNLRFAESFLVLFLLDVGQSFTAIGAALGYQHLLTAFLEFPFGIVADRFGRRRTLAACFLCYVFSFSAFALVRDQGIAVLYLALTLFGLGEALRTGTHKAIMLDYLDSRGESERITRVIGLTRSVSKSSAAVAALVGGLVLFVSRAYELLFWLSAATAFLGFLLMLSYPRSLEGEQQRDRERGEPGPAERLGARLLAAARRPGVAPLFVQSTLFESQVKLILSYYLSPLLKNGLAGFGLVVLGPGALWIGLTEAVRNAVGGIGSLVSNRAREGFGATRALQIAYGSCFLLAAAIAWFAYRGALIPLVVALVAVTFLQNSRRPIFVGEFNAVIDGPQRATALSAESLARSVCVALLLPLTGLAADLWGLWAAVVVITAVLLPAVALVHTRRG